MVTYLPPNLQCGSASPHPIFFCIPLSYLDATAGYASSSEGTLPRHASLAVQPLTNSAFAFPILRRFHFHPRQSMYRRNLLPSIRRRSCSLTFVYAAARRCQRGTFVEHSSSPPPLPGRHTSPRRSVIRQIFFHCRWAPDFTIFRLHRS